MKSFELQNRLSAESNARDVGKTSRLMVEGVSKRFQRAAFLAVHSKTRWWSLIVGIIYR